MLIIPSLLLVIAGFAVFIINKRQKRFSSPWLTSIIPTLLVWVGMIIFHFFPPDSISLPLWETPGGIEQTIILQLDLKSWVSAIALVTVLLAVLLTAALRIEKETRLFPQYLILTGTGILMIFSGSPITLIFTFTLLDIVEAGLLFAINQEKENRNGALSVSLKLMSTLLLFLVVLLSKSTDYPFIVDADNLFLNLVLLLAIILRIGVFPFQFHYSGYTRGITGLDVLDQSVLVLSTMMVLTHTESITLNSFWTNFVMVILLLMIVLELLRSYLLETESSGKPTFLALNVAYLLYVFITGAQDAILPWGICFLLTFAAMNLYTYRNQFIQIMLYFGTISIVGFPFTPNELGFGIFDFNHLDIWTIAFLLMMVFISAVYFRRIISVENRLPGQEGWMKAVSSLGFLGLIGVPWLLSYLGWNSNLKTSNPVPGFLILLSLAVLILITNQIEKNARMQSEIKRWVDFIRSNIWHPVSQSITVDKGLNLIESAIQFFTSTANRLSQLLEGRGGILWSFILLVLLFTILRNAGIVE